MATAGIILARNVDLLWGGVGIDKLQSVSFSGSSTEIPLTSYDSAQFEEWKSGTMGGSVDITFLVAYDATEGFNEMLADWLAGTQQAVLITTAETGDTTVAGTAGITSFSFSGDTDSPKSASATLKFTGTIAQGTVA